MNGTVQNLKEAWQKMPGKTKKMIDSHCSGDDYPGGSRTSGPEYRHEKRIQYLVYRNELG